MKASPLLAVLLLTQCARLAPQPAYPSQPQATYPPPRQAYAQPQPAPRFQPQPQSQSQPQPQAPTYYRSTWQRTSSVRTQSLAAGARFHEFTARNGTESAQVEMVTFDSQSCVFRVLDQPSPHAGGGVIAPLMRRAGAIAGVNGGFFHPDFSTLGLMIADGRKTGQFVKTSLVSGAMIVIGREPYLVWNHEFLGSSGVSQMLQAGPRLVDSGQPLPTLNRTRNSVRTFVATDGQRHWAIGTVRYTTLAGLGELLASNGVLPGIQVQRALNLDGGRSTALYVRKSDGQEVSQPGWSTVRNYLAIVPR